MNTVDQTLQFVSCEENGRYNDTTDDVEWYDQLKKIAPAIANENH